MTPNAKQGKQEPTAEQDRVPLSDLRPKACAKEPCAETGPKPTPPPVKLCKDGPCLVCAPGQAPGKGSACAPATVAKASTTPAKAPAGPQACPAGQIWNGVQCALVGAQQCLPGQTTVGTTCQPDCAIATAGAQNWIQLLRMAHQDKDSACLKDPTGDECRRAESTYELRLNEYRNYLGGVPTACTLPDPITI